MTFGSVDQALSAKERIFIYAKAGLTIILKLVSTEQKSTNIILLNNNF